MKEELFINKAKLGIEALSLIYPITNKEKEVMLLVAEGLTNKEIALKLNISKDTAKAHVCSVIYKLKVKNRIQIALSCIVQGQKAIKEG